MHSDSRQLDDHSVIEGDICIVGAGAAGISMALEWINTPYKVILLEGGGFDYDDKIQELARGKVTGQAYYPLKSTRLLYFGGTTGHWGGLCSIFEPLAFQKREWIDESGWPFANTEMLPFYKRANSVLDLGEYAFDLDYWQKKNDFLSPLPLDEKIFWTKIWRYGVPTAMHFGSVYRDRIVNAKNIHLHTYARVVDIVANENLSSVREMTVRNYAGKKHKVVAKYFILACCAIQNSRLLLSSNKQFAKGLGNKYDLVGRYFMENIEMKSAELWLRKKSALQLYMRNSPNFRGELALTPEVQSRNRILNGMLSFNPLEIAKKKPSLIKSWTADDPREDRKKVAEIDAKATDKSRIERMFSSDEYHAFEVTMRLEQAPNPLSRVWLDTEKDELGVPRANLHWEFTAMEKRSAFKIYELFGEQLGISGTGRLKLLDELQDRASAAMPTTTSGGWHHMGTTRMHNDPKKGVVDANCKVHGLSNLFIAGSSCFPNGAAVNPTFTIVALSLRLSDHLKEKIKKSNILT